MVGNFCLTFFAKITIRKSEHNSAFALHNYTKEDTPMAELFKRLVILEMANNHMGDVQHGLRIIREFFEVAKVFQDRFTFAFKFQYRDLNTFIHPDYQGRMDHKYVKRFSETRLTEQEFLTLKAEAEAFGFMTICTPFDEVSVEKVVKHGYDVLKIASASFTDWPLLEEIAKTDLPIIASTGGSKLEDIDRVVSFFQHRNKQFALMHCVGEYPTVMEQLQLNQIDLFRQRYPGVLIGFSTHEEPWNTQAVRIAIAKGAEIFEKHVGVETDAYQLNTYSATPLQVAQWLQAAVETYEACGVIGERHQHSEKELADIRQFQRGAFASCIIKRGDRIMVGNTFFAFPNRPGQLLANDLSKYVEFTAREILGGRDPVVNVDRVDNREVVEAIIDKVKAILDEANIPMSGGYDFEISHHYGIERFEEAGAVIITCVNNEDYAKKLIILFPGQGRHPVHYHKRKKETFHVLYGDATFTLDGEAVKAKPGDSITVERGVRHDFSTVEGVVFEEISSTHYKDDSFYDDESIMGNPHRKTAVTHWF